MCFNGDMNSDTIKTLTGQHAILSNFAPTPITIDGIEYPTAEHAFQAAKTHDPVTKRAIAAKATPGQAKYAGKRVNLRPDWEEVKTEVMADIIRIKFSPGTEAAAHLMATGDAHIEEGNTWNDTTWGVSLRTGKGQNRLGQILMDIRSHLS